MRQTCGGFIGNRGRYDRDFRCVGEGDVVCRHHRAGVRHETGGGIPDKGFLRIIEDSDQGHTALCNLLMVLALGLYWGLPMSLEICQTLAIVMLAPVTSICPAYTGRLGGDVELSSTINSVEIVISIILITCALMLLL